VINFSDQQNDEQWPVSGTLYLNLRGKNAPLYIVSLYTVIFGNLTPIKKERPHLTAKNLASLSNKSKLTEA
jgi:hypothetical protein